MSCCLGAVRLPFVAIAILISSDWCSVARDELEGWCGCQLPCCRKVWVPRVQSKEEVCGVSRLYVCVVLTVVAACCVA